MNGVVYYYTCLFVEILLWTIEHANNHSKLQCNVLPVTSKESLQSELSMPNIFHDTLACVGASCWGILDDCFHHHRVKQIWVKSN